MIRRCQQICCTNDCFRIIISKRWPSKWCIFAWNIPTCLRWFWISRWIGWCWGRNRVSTKEKDKEKVNWWDNYSETYWTNEKTSITWGCARIHSRFEKIKIMIFMLGPCYDIRIILDMGRHRSCSSDRNSSDSRDSRKRHRRKRSRSRSERRRDIKEEKYERNSDDYRLNKHSRYRNNSSERY